MIESVKASAVVCYESGAPIVRNEDLERFVSRVMAAAGLENGEVFTVGNWDALFAVRLVMAGRRLDRSIVQFKVSLEENADAEVTYWKPSGGCE